MRINDESLLKELRKNSDKSQRVNSYKVKYTKHDGKYEELTFEQGYDSSTDIYNPFFIRVYNSENSYIMSGSGSTIESSYINLITSLILYMLTYKDKSNKCNLKFSQIIGIINPNITDDNFDDRF